VPRTVINELLNGAQKDFDELTREAPATPMLGLQRARLHRLFARLHGVAGDTAQQNAMATRALEALARLPTTRRIEAPRTWFVQLPAANDVQIERLLALDVLGQAKKADGDLSGARSTFQEMARDADALVEDLGHVAVRSLAANARSHLARLSYESGDLEKALHEYREAGTLLSSHAADSKVARDLAMIQSDEAEMLFELGRHAEALARQEVAVETLEKASGRTPENAQALANALARRGDMRLGTHRDLDGARADYVTAQSMLAELLASDGARTDFKRDLSLVHDRVGDALLQAEDVEGAREAFVAGLAVRRELVARDASNAEWRRDLSVALERIGQVESLRGRHDAASAALTEALRLREAALNENAGDVVAARDLAILLMQVGKARHAARAKLPEIEAAYGRAIDLLLPLVEKSTAESRLRRDLAVAYAERGEARRNAGNLSGARSDTRAALALITDLRAVAPDDAQLAEDESWLRKRLRR
jgi:tetratricopeptide (TPR) repeat protein